MDLQKKIRPLHGRGEGWDKAVGVTLGWTVRGSNPYGGEVFRPCQTDPEAHPVTCTVLPDPSMMKTIEEWCRAEIANGLELYTGPSLFQHKDVMGEALHHLTFWHRSFTFKF
jgi:hypothetical protein